MRDGERFCVLLLPSRFDGAWRQALRECANRMDWIYLEPWLDEPLDFDRSRNVLFVLGDMLNEVAATRWAVIAPDADHVLASSIEVFGLDERQGILHASDRLTKAKHLLDAGWPLLDAEALSLNLQDLGLVARSEVAGQSDGGHVVPALPEAHPLSIFKRRSDGQPKAIAWERYLLQGIDGAAVGEDGLLVDLTGRARTVIANLPVRLPAGTWRAKARFEVEVLSAKPLLAFEWGHGTDVERIDMEFERSGQYDCTLVRDWAWPEEMQFRISVLRPVFDGRLKLQSCEVTALAIGAADL